MKYYRCFLKIQSLLSTIQIYVGCDASETRVDCHPEPGATQERCIARGCCWHPEGANWCFHPNEKGNFIAIVIVRASIRWNNYIWKSNILYVSFLHSAELSHEEKCCKNKKVPRQCFELCNPADEVIRGSDKYGDNGLLRYCTTYWDAIDQCKKGEFSNDNSLLLEYSIILDTLFNDIQVNVLIFRATFARTEML